MEALIALLFVAQAGVVYTLYIQMARIKELEYWGNMADDVIGMMMEETIEKAPKKRGRPKKNVVR